MTELTKIDVLENSSLVTDLDCGQENNPDAGLDACQVRDDNGYDKPVAYTLTLGDVLTDTVNSSQGDKLEVGPVLGSDADGSYYILVSDDEDPSKRDSVYFSGDVDAGGSFTADNGGDKFGSETFVHIFSEDGGTLLQTINFHTSCSAPLVIGDQYGSVSLGGYTFEENGSEIVYGISDEAGDEGVTYSIQGGADAALFTVNAATGEVSFIDAPDFENPQDADGDNNYDVVVRATRDDGTFEDKPLEVCVEDDCIKIAENTTAVIDLDCGQENNPDNGLDACDVRDDNGYDKPVAYTLTLGDELTDEVNSSQGDKLEVGSVMGSDPDGSYFILVSGDEDASKRDEVFFSGDVDAGGSFTAQEGSDSFVMALPNRRI